jgi:hypothetical protein
MCVCMIRYIEMLLLAMHRRSLRITVEEKRVVSKRKLTMVMSCLSCNK